MRRTFLSALFMAAVAACAAGAAGLDRSQFHIGCFAFNGRATPKRLELVRECGLDWINGGIFLRPYTNRSGTFKPNFSSANADDCAAVGVSVVPFWRHWTNIRGATAELFRDNPTNYIDEIVEDFATNHAHRAIRMLELVDEPGAQSFGFFAEVLRRLEACDCGVLAYINLYPNYARVVENTGDERTSQLGTRTYEEYIRCYAETVPTHYIAYDHYPIGATPDTTRKMMAPWYGNLKVVADACRATGRDLWVGPQANSRPGCPFTTENQLRYQAFSSMAFGAVNLTWACWDYGWWTNQVMNRDGTPSEQYAKLKAVNAEVRRLAESYMAFTNAATHFVGFDADRDALAEYDIATVGSLDLAAVGGLAATDGSPLVVGEMAPRAAGDPRRALFIYAAGDPEDIRRETHTIAFTPALLNGSPPAVTSIGPNGPIPIAPPRGASASCAIDLRDNSAVFLVFAPRHIDTTSP